MPRTHLHHVHSIPVKVSPQIWEQWYLEERSRDMVHFHVSSTAAFYERSSDFLTYLKPPTAADGVGNGVDEMPYLALYQMGKTIPRYMDEYQRNVRVRSELWDKELGTCFAVARFASEHLELVEVLGSYEFSEDVAPFIIHTKIIGDEVEAKLQFEHVNATSKLDGYRRSLLYRPVDLTKDATPYVIMIHEFDADPGDLTSVKADMEAIEPSRDCAFYLRSFKLLGSEGFGGSECRLPQRLKQ